MGPKGSKVEAVYGRIGKVILRARRRRGVTQDGVARAVGWTRASIANIEAGRQRVGLHDLPQLAKALRVPISQLLDPRWIPRRKR